MDEPQKKRDKVCVGIDRGTGGDLCAYVIAKVTPDKHIYILFYGTAEFDRDPSERLIACSEWVA